MHFLDDVTENVEYEYINWNILDGNDMNMYLIIIEVNYSTIYDDYSTWHGYYIIIFSSSPYTLQADFNIEGQVISSGEIVCEVTYYFPINTNSNYYVTPKKSNNKIVYLSTMINGNIKIIYYDSNAVVPTSLR